MVSLLKALGGTSDILGPEAALWQRMEQAARRTLEQYGVQEIRTPLIEEAAVFTRSLGEQAEIVTKQMYLFQDRGGRCVALRPEGTASVVRALIEHGLDKTAGVSRFYYLGPMFRAERPQKGRQRQFHQLGVELFGSLSPYQDVEVLCLLVRLLEVWGVRGWTLSMNSLGCRQDREKIVEGVRSRLSSHRDRLCGDCRDRLERNPLRILDCKEPGCRALSEGVDFLESVCGPCRAHFQTVLEGMEALKIPFARDPHLVRGLDYYSRTAFEVVHGGLGTQNALGGGGRYDELVEAMGGKPLPAVGFAVGLERVLLAQERAGPEGPSIAVFLATVTPKEIPLALEWARKIRARGISAGVNLEDRPLKRQMEQAAKLGVRRTLIFGPEEAAEGVVLVKEMKSGRQEKEPLSGLEEALVARLSDGP